MGWEFWVDRGGTFTDIVAKNPEGRLSTLKLLSENPEHYDDAAVAGIKRVLGLAPNAPLPGGLVARVKMGTTVATNALLERKGARTLLVVNEGFADLCAIGTQARPRLFDLNIRRPALLYERVAEIGARVAVDGQVIEPLDEAAALALLTRAKQDGYEAVAIALIHAWAHPMLEIRLGELARRVGFEQVSLSHVASPLLRLGPRADTTVADAYLSPVLARYLAMVSGGLSAGGGEAPALYFMQSHGGLARAAAVSGKDAILSGPAGGIVGAVKTARAAGIEAVIGFDMGGTSTDVSLYDGAYARVFETEIAGVRLRAPMMAINTVAAGGGSILSFEAGRLKVGPESAGANPGPACYRKGGPLTVTDANLLLGKIRPEYFPAIFGPHGDERLDEAVVAAKFAALARDVSQATGQPMTPYALAEGFVRIANANMAQAIRQISVQKGLNPADFTLVCFGGAGGQHALRVADELGIEQVFIHPFAGVLSAFGIGLSDVSVLREQAVEMALTPETLPELKARAAALAAEAEAAVAAQAPNGAARTTLSLLLRYAGTDTALPVALGELAEMVAAFEAAHRRLFGFVTPEAGLVADTLLAECAAAGETLAEPALAPAPLPAPLGRVALFAEGAHHDAPVYERAALGAGARIAGPAILKEALATTVVEPGWEAEITARDHCLLRRVAPRAAARAVPGTQADPVRLELFANMFMAVAEQAGAVLRNTARSVNIKERLDFSCALFDEAGNLIANAPHVPVHLGAMGASVRHVIATRGGTLKPGDAVALNNPYAGGTHLPDITLITPVFVDGALVFFTACRGHHADIGGLTPGSTPPFSTTLEEEGVVIDDLLIRAGGRFLEAEFRAVLAGARYPARNPDQNVADMKAQIAANDAAAQALGAMVAQHGLASVRAYMGHVMDQAEAATRAAIRRLKDAAFTYPLDDGAVLRLALRIDPARGEAVIDFTGTSGASGGNFNAPRAVTTAAVLYAFRCLTGTELPLNEGCLRPLTMIVPDGTFLSPPPGRAVVAGNTEVSQAVTSALLGAMGAAAASQSTMNNFLFGNATYQYYETICGGAGAGPGFDGADAVQTHMTNTRITDPEVLELRYPVRVEAFSIRRGSGGAGIFHGGDGVIRKIRFLEPMTVTITASSRNVAPFGLSGGAPGAVGTQRLERADGRVEALAGVGQAELAAGDAVTIETPGGGGYGGAA